MKSWRKRLEQQLYYRAITLVIATQPPDYHKVTCDWVARQLEVTSEHLSRTFRKETEISFSYFLEQTKVRWSLGLIKENSGIHVNELAAVIGYNSVNQFIKMFKKHMGITPARFRKTFKEIEEEQALTVR
jgi:YesN/AraC family two-component response regulator